MKRRRFIVRARGIKETFSGHQVPINFGVLSIDVESRTELALAREVLEDGYRPQYIVIESHEEGDIHPEYEFLGRWHYNVLYRRRDKQ